MKIWTKKLVVEYMYEGTIEITSENAVPLLSMAQYLSIQVWFFVSCGSGMNKNIQTGLEKSNYKFSIQRDHQIKCPHNFEKGSWTQHRYFHFIGEEKLLSNVKKKKICDVQKLLQIDVCLLLHAISLNCVLLEFPLIFCLWIFFWILLLILL